MIRQVGTAGDRLVERCWDMSRQRSKHSCWLQCWLQCWLLIWKDMKIVVFSRLKKRLACKAVAHQVDYRLKSSLAPPCAHHKNVESVGKPWFIGLIFQFPMYISSWYHNRLNNTRTTSLRPQQLSVTPSTCNAPRCLPSTIKKPSVFHKRLWSCDKNFHDNESARIRDGQ